MTNRSFAAQLRAGLLLAIATLGLTSCAVKIYYYPQYNYAGRATPPSGLLQRVMAAYTANGSSGGLEILDGYRDLRSNVQNTIPRFAISGYSEADPVSIINYPEEQTGYVLSLNDGNLSIINYGKESTAGAAAGYGASTPSAAAAPNGTTFAGAAEQNGQLIATINGTTYYFSLPNVDKVVIDQGNTVILAMVRNSNTLYRIVKLPATTSPVTPPGAIDCEPLLLPTYCVVPVADTNSAGVHQAAFDRPTNVYFSLDGTTAYVLNCGPECGGTTAGVTFLQMAALEFTNVPTVDPLCGDPGHVSCPAGTVSPLLSLPVANPVPVPGGVTAALSDGTNLYLAGQQLQGNGLFAGNLSLLNLSTYTVGPKYSISDGTHTKMLFAENNTLWIGSSQCENGVRALAAANGATSQAANTNCLTRYVTNSVLAGGSNAVLPSWSANTAYTVGEQICDGPVAANAAGCASGNIEIVKTAGTSGGSAPTWKTTTDATTSDAGVTWVNIGPISPVQIIPAVTPNSAAYTLQYENTNQDQYYYGSLTGICWVQLYNKVYTAYGGQIHAFNTSDGSERDNTNITIQGTVLDVAYMDALTNSAN